MVNIAGCDKLTRRYFRIRKAIVTTTPIKTTATTLAIIQPNVSAGMCTGRVTVDLIDIVNT
jgi:hypothetical protein